MMHSRFCPHVHEPLGPGAAAPPRAAYLSDPDKLHPPSPDERALVQLVPALRAAFDASRLPRLTDSPPLLPRESSGESITTLPCSDVPPRRIAGRSRDP